MQFTIAREDLLKPLQQIMGAVEKRHTKPILSNVLLKVSNTRLTAIATDLEIELHGTVLLSSVIIAGEVTVPARKLFDICRALPELKEISIVSQGDHVLISCEKSRFKLATLPVDEFPNMEEGMAKQEFSLNQAELRKLIEGVSFSMAQQDVRYYLNGIYLIKSPTFLKAVSADGHRLSLSHCSMELGGAETKVIIPRKGVIELLRLLATNEASISVSISSNHLRVSSNEYTFITKLIDGVFPDYQKVIPKNANKEIIIDKDLFKQTLSRTAILSNEKYHGVKLYLESGKLVVEAHNSEHEEAYEEISVNYQSDSLEIGFNVSYLLDAINALPKGNMRILFVDNNSSIQMESVESNGCLYVIMPMRI